MSVITTFVTIKFVITEFGRVKLILTNFVITDNFFVMITYVLTNLFFIPKFHNFAILVKICKLIFITKYLLLHQYTTELRVFPSCLIIYFAKILQNLVSLSNTLFLEQTHMCVAGFFQMGCEILLQGHAWLVLFKFKLCNGSDKQLLL